MHIAVTGSSGFIGTALSSRLMSLGHTVTPLSRRQAPDSRVWNPTGITSPTIFDDVDVVVHLAGEPIGTGRWNRAKKKKIRRSRVDGTRSIATAIAHSGTPKTLISTSAVGLYGDRGNTVVSEQQPRGNSFLAGVTAAWEKSADPARRTGVRVVHPRLGIVLHPSGGALARMLPLFRLGLGGTLGNGTQWWPWVHQNDVVSALVWFIENETADGAYNVTAPVPVTNQTFTETLGSVLNRPTPLPVPAFGPKLLLGEMAEALLFDSARVVPERLVTEGFNFFYPELRGALVDLVRSPGI